MDVFLMVEQVGRAIAMAGQMHRAIAMAGQVGRAIAIGKVIPIIAQAMVLELVTRRASRSFQKATTVAIMVTTAASS